MVDHQADYCILPAVDAYRLGYSEAALQDYAPNLVKISTSIGFANACLFRITEVSLGTFSSKDVEFLAFDIYQANCCDVILGRSFLKDFKISIDAVQKRINVQRA